MTSGPEFFRRPAGVTRALLEDLVARGETIAVAESLTAGLVCAAIADVPGSSRALRGGVCTYAADAKVSVLGVPEAVLAEHGVVSEAVALAMADGARRVLGADWALATTGVAGPGPADGQPAGTVCVALVGPTARLGATWRLPGDRADVRTGTVTALLTLARDTLADAVRAPDGGR